MTYPLLDEINNPNDLKQLDVSDLPILCEELRHYVLESVSQTGGHLASGLGVIELTVAIHYVFNTPEDSLIWDVGHQAYPHKVLTERKSKMKTLKKINGLSGFPKRSESKYDDFGVGHSSTSISAALGMAIASQLQQKNNEHIAVIGDGAMTAGIAFEALQHSASLSANILVILNDNEMSISPSVGGLSSYLSKILVSDLYNDVRSTGKKLLKHLPPFDGLAKFAEDRVKEIAGFSNVFEDLGFDYSGPEDGHDVIGLVKILIEMKSKKGPRLLHIKTKKGKGYKKSEVEPVAYHGVPEFNIAEGLLKRETSLTFTKVFSQWLCNTAELDENLVGITPAMREGSGLIEFSEKFPNRYFDVAIAEQHALTLAAGMACKGLKPVVAIYSTFLQRAYDQLIHDIALQNLNVLFAVDRAGVVGEDGATHSGVFDLAFSRLIPQMIVMTPSDELEMTKMLNTGYYHNGPALVRYPKGSGSIGSVDYTKKTIPIGQSKTIRNGEGLAILVFGTLLSNCITIANELNATLIDMRFVKPFDKSMLIKLVEEHTHIVSIEEGCIIGGVGESIQYFIAQQNNQMNKKPNNLIKIKLLGLSDEFVEHGTREQILSNYQLDVIGLPTAIKNFYQDN